MNFLQKLLSKIFAYKVAETVQPGAGAEMVKQDVQQQVVTVAGSIDIVKIRENAIAKIKELAQKLIDTVNAFIEAKARPIVTAAKANAAALRTKDKLGLTQIPQLKAYFDKVDGLDLALDQAKQAALNYITQEQTAAIAKINEATTEEAVNAALMSGLDVITKSETLILNNIQEKVTIF